MEIWEQIRIKPSIIFIHHIFLHLYEVKVRKATLTAIKTSYTPVKTAVDFYHKEQSILYSGIYN